MLTAFYVLIVIATIIFTVVAWTTLAWMLHAWRSADALERTRFRHSTAAPAHRFSLIVPARHEERVLPTTLERLADINHPNYEVWVVVGHDDPQTMAVAQEAASRYSDRIHVIEDVNEVKNKPRALNTALPHCDGDFVGVFDAEDLVHRDLLLRVDQCLQETGADVVQSGVQLVNFRSSWFSVRNVLEYYFWFKSRLHHHAEHGFIPLGGNTVFMRRNLVQQNGGWDPNCLAEDCEIGTRLSSHGAKTVVAYDPELATLEETPDSLGDLFRQRTRWVQGFLQVLGKGEWKRLRGTRRFLALFTLGMPFLQALAGVFIPLSILSIFVLHAPLPLALFTFLPAIPTLAILAVELAGLGAFCRDYGQRARAIDYVRLIVGTLPYQLVLSVAAIRAVGRQVRGNLNWEKTAHVGAHLS